MSEVWNVCPKEGLGPLEFGMTHAEVAEFENIMGPLDETTEEILPNGRVTQNEYRDSGSPTCSFENGILTHIGLRKSEIIDVKFQDVSIFNDNSQDVYSTLGRSAGAVYWHHNSVVMPSLCLELIGFVMEYSPKGKPPVFKSKTAGFTWPRLRLFKPGHLPFDEKNLIEISNEVA
ncbi:hypothetical protein [Luteimonas salinilitoris]|uniref:Uncharacterized protein n=1 Tax=Luteimonas salinilitoris TaxID=3237697 RepID=A0ABV4HQ05_9GAMM